jgi:hypothetical protein
MGLLDPGDLWDLLGGKRVEILDRAFIALGKRYVAVLDYDFDEPRLIEVARFVGAEKTA